MKLAHTFLFIYLFAPSQTFASDPFSFVSSSDSQSCSSVSAPPCVDLKETLDELLAQQGCTYKLLTDIACFAFECRLDELFKEIRDYLWENLQQGPRFYKYFVQRMRNLRAQRANEDAEALWREISEDQLRNEFQTDNKGLSSSTTLKRSKKERRKDSKVAKKGAATSCKSSKKTERVKKRIRRKAKA